MMLNKFVLIAFVTLALSPAVNAQQVPIATEATATKPLSKGVKVPDVNLTTSDGKIVPLASLHQAKPLIIVFFRGGWCPICSKHTQQLIKVYPQLKENGFEMIGVSPDTAENTKANMEKGSIPFRLYSDSELNASRSFGLAFKVDDATITKYKGFGIDLEKASGQTHHALPIPAIYVVSKEGLITFAHSNPDYRQRLDANVLLKEISK
jgi:peroxiredoxin